MTPKEYMSMAYGIDQSINSKLEQISSLRSMAAVGSKLMSDMPGSPNRNISKMENTIIKVIMLEEEINADIDELVDLKAEIYGVINSIEEEDYKTLLEQRYLCFRDWKDIAVFMRYNERYIYKLHGKALAAVKVPEKYNKTGQ